ncbi:spermidine/putrescine ABC transporter permease PotB [Paraferrimonas sp. SM1919]|uniref:spermidine/putrescine ABC transporter permease PotB n=1 Tax=Paraferrimonas sp. SM1919 TaxID=2662263 RepID=UPI0013D8DC80|nr:spermidine/putrescine ABC transporter permease PotB [Paraferrimonas sp. SM1919]
MKTSQAFKWFSLTLAFGWLIIFVLIPNAMVVLASFLSRDPSNLISLEWNILSYQRLLDPMYLEILMHSLFMAGIATILCLIIGYPTAWIISSFGPIGRALLLFMIIVPFWTNSLIRTYAIKIILGTNGVLNWLMLNLGLIDKPIKFMYTEAAVIFGLVYILLPFMILPLYSAIEKLPNSLKDAAKDLGANNFHYFTKIMLPLTMPGIIAGTLMVFLPAMGMFYLSDLLGGSKNLLVGNVIRDQIMIVRDWPFGSAFSTALTVIMGLLLWVYFVQLNRRNKELDNG